MVVMENAFHGRTLGTMAASDGPSVRLGFQRLPGDFLKVGFGDLAALEAITQTFGTRIAAVLLEPIQGESGVQMAPAGYLKALRAHCTRHGWLMMLDEIQTGIGRTGAWFAFQHEGIVPDVMTLAKGLGQRRAHRRLPGQEHGGRVVHPWQPRQHVRRQPIGLSGGLHRAGDH